MTEKHKNSASSNNQDEGNGTAAREYNSAQQQFVKSGQVNSKAKEAERDLDDESIRRELEHAEAIGKRHAASGDPFVKRR